MRIRFVDIGSPDEPGDYPASDGINVRVTEETIAAVRRLGVGKAVLCLKAFSCNGSIQFYEVTRVRPP